MTVETVLPIVLYFLGAILLVALIVLTVKLIITMNKIEKTVDNISDKVKTLDGLFEIINMFTGKFYLVTDKIVEYATLLVEKIFKGKDDKNE